MKIILFLLLFAGWMTTANTETNTLLLGTSTPPVALTFPEFRGDFTITSNEFYSFSSNFYISTNGIKQLAKDGKICEVFGHWWHDGRVGEGDGFIFADNHPNTLYRHCHICETTESQTINDWKQYQTNGEQ